MATAAQKRAYQHKLNAIMHRQRLLDEDTVKRAIQMLENMRASIGGELLMTDPGTFGEHRLKSLRRSLEQLTNDFQNQLIAMTRQNVTTSFINGGESVADPLRAAGIHGRFFKPSPAQVNVLLDFSADLIKDITGTMLGQINTQIRLAALGQVGTFETMQAITKILGTRDGRRRVVKGVAARAETILRTETQRAYNVAAMGEIRSTQDQFPDDTILKRWIATGDFRTRDSHLAVHQSTKDKPIPAVNPFVVGGAFLQHPNDPAGPAGETISCRCRVQVIHPDIGVIPSPLDDRIDAEIAKRKAEKAEKEQAEIAKALQDVPAGPAGVPVSGAMQIPKSGKFRPKYLDVMQSIDSIHGDGPLDDLPIRTKALGGGTLGHFKYNWDGTANEIAIKGKGGSHHELTLAHEVGHWLDHQTIGGRGKYASPDHDIMQGWRDAIAGSDAAQDLLDKMLNPQNHEVDIVYSFGTISSTPSVRYLRYLTNDKEMWARSYAQYVAHRSGNRTMLDQVDKEREDKMYGSSQWDSDDFEPIAQAMDQLFEDLGWLKR
jgi:hypothetical protein